MLGHSEPLRRYSERNDGVTDHTERRSGGTASAAIHNSLRSLCRRYTRSQMWERAFMLRMQRLTEISGCCKFVFKISVNRYDIGAVAVASLKFVKRRSDRRSLAMFWSLLKKLQQIATE